MSITFLFIFAALSLIFGIVFIVRGIRSYRDEESAVPISSIEEIKEVKSALIKQQGQTENAESLSQHVIRENLAGNKVESLQPKNVSSNEDMRLKMEAEIKIIKSHADQHVKEINDKNRELLVENDRLDEALSREISSKDTITLSEEENRQWEESKKQLEQAQESLSRLTDENQKLKSFLNDQSGKIQQLEQAYNESRKSQDEPLNDRAVQIKAYEEKISAFLEQQAEFEKTQQLLDQMKEENESFKKHSEHLLTENQELLRRQESSNEKIRELQDNVKLINRRNEQIVDNTNQEMASLKDQIAHIKGEELSRLSEEDQGVWKNERIHSVQEREEFERNFTKIKEFNDHLLEKEKILHYELTKSRAQNLGLERICEDFKDQIEKTSRITT